MYEPIKFFKENECPYCSRKLVLVDIDMTVSQIDSDGMMLSGNWRGGNKIFLYCNTCKKKYDVEKKGQFVRIKRKTQIASFGNPLYRNKGDHHED